jgi:hypothetical protein
MPVLNQLPAGDNKCIGSYANESTGKLYSFIYNSNGVDTITEYDNTLNTISIVLQGNYLSFGEYNYINGAGIAGDNLLYWTDGVNPPRSIDITKAKSGEYYTDSSSISLIKTPPQELITAQYADDPVNTTASNRLKNQLFQFRYLYVYEDNTRSAWSSCSKVPLPQFEVNPATDTRAYKNNNIRIAFDAGTKFVKSIELAALVKGVSTTTSTQDWFSILTIDRANVIQNIDNQFSYNPDDNTAIFTFYNDGLYQSIDILETDLPYDYVPLTAKTLEIVNGNVLVLGNNKEGYDNITPDVGLFVTYALPVTNQLQEIGYSTYGYPEFIGIPTEGDTIFYQWDTVNNNSYTVTDDTSGSLYNTLVALGNKIQTDTGSGIEFLGVVAGHTPGSYKLDLYYAPSVLSAISVSLADVSNSVASYKTNSRYQLGLVYYDDKNRSSYVQTNDNFIVSTDSWGETQGKAPTINWIIRHNAPDWATKYQWVRTEQLTHKSFLFWTATTATANAEDTIYDLDISSLITYNTDNPNSILAYDFSVGDRCTIHKQNATWVTGYDVAVVAYTQTSTTATLQIQKKTGALTPGAAGILLEVYTPKTRANTTTEQFFYEFGEQYPCAAGVHSVETGSFVDGDIYDRQRAIPTTGAIGIEDPNFSDFYISNYSSNGRANIFAPQAKQLTLPTDIRFSDTYVPNTNINGLSRFYGDAFETYDRVNGSIQKLAVRDNYLMTFQELKTGYIPILQSIIEDQGAGNAANVAISNKLLNKIRYFAGDFGIGLNPESFARYAGTMYFIDPNRGFVLKLVQGLQPISVSGMDSYFTGKLASVRTITNMKLLGSYDPRNDEYIITFKYPTGGGTSETIAFNETINRWTSFYSFTPEYADHIFNKYMGFNNGIMWEHNSSNNYNSFYGTSYNSIVQLTFNGTPSLVKSFIGLMEQSNTVWSADSNIISSVETAVTTNLGQTSNLLSTDFSKKEGVWFASILRDASSPGGIVNGDELKGNLIKFKLVNPPTEKASLLSVDLRYIPSYQGIK